MLEEEDTVPAGTEVLELMTVRAPVLVDIELGTVLDPPMLLEDVPPTGKTDAKVEVVWRDAAGLDDAGVDEAGEDVNGVELPASGLEDVKGSDELTGTTAVEDPARGVLDLGLEVI